MANFAYQVTGFAYQGAGQFAYQGSAEDEVDVTLWGRIRQDAKRRARIEQEDVEILRILRTEIIPRILRRRRH